VLAIAVVRVRTLTVYTQRNPCCINFGSRGLPEYILHEQRPIKSNHLVGHVHIPHYRCCEICKPTRKTGLLGAPHSIAKRMQYSLSSDRRATIYLGTLPVELRARQTPRKAAEANTVIISFAPVFPTLLSISSPRSTLRSLLSAGHG
jgi:hypothetical protein